MTKEKREDIQIWSAVGMLIIGAVLCFVGFFTPPVGEVHESILWAIGQFLAIGGALLGVVTYVGSVSSRVAKVENKIMEREKEGKRYDN